MSDTPDAAPVTEAALDAATRATIPKAQSAPADQGDAPIRDNTPLENAEHVRAALARLEQTDFDSDDAKRAAHGRIMDAAKRLGVDVNDSDDDAPTTAAKPVQEALDITQVPGAPPAVAPRVTPPLTLPPAPPPPQSPRIDFSGTAQTTGIHEAQAVQFSQIDPTQRTALFQLMGVGPGNLKAKNYYTESALHDLARLTVGRPMYINHKGPDDIARGHRDVRMKAAIIKESWYDPTRHATLGKVRFLPTHAWVPAALADDPDAVQASVDGAGTGRPGTVDGVSYRSIVEHMTHVASVDLVPEAGAQGHFLQFSEAQQDVLTHEETLDMLDNLTPAEVRDANPALYDEIGALFVSESAPLFPEPDPLAVQAQIATAITEALAPWQDKTELLMKERDALLRANNERECATFIRETLELEGLPPTAVDYLAARFAGATTGPSGVYPEGAALQDALISEATAYKDSLPPAPEPVAPIAPTTSATTPQRTGMVTGMGPGKIDEVAIGEAMFGRARTRPTTSAPASVPDPGFVSPFAAASDALGSLMGSGARLASTHLAPELARRQQATAGTLEVGV